MSAAEPEAECVREGCDWPVEFPDGQCEGIRCIAHCYETWRIDQEPYRFTTIDFWHPEYRMRDVVIVNIHIGSHSIYSEDIDLTGGGEVRR